MPPVFPPQLFNDKNIYIHSELNYKKKTLHQDKLYSHNGWWLLIYNNLFRLLIWLSMYGGDRLVSSNGCDASGWAVTALEAIKTLDADRSRFEPILGRGATLSGWRHRWTSRVSLDRTQFGFAETGVVY